MWVVAELLPGRVEEAALKLNQPTLNQPTLVEELQAVQEAALKVPLGAEAAMLL